MTFAPGDRVFRRDNPYPHGTVIREVPWPPSGGEAWSHLPPDSPGQGDSPVYEVQLDGDQFTVPWDSGIVVVRGAYLRHECSETVRRFGRPSPCGQPATRRGEDGRWWCGWHGAGR